MRKKEDHEDGLPFLESQIGDKKRKKIMEKTEKRERWLLVLAGFLLSGVNVGINTNCNTAFLNPVCEDLGLGISRFAMTTSIVSFISIPCLLLLPILLKKMSVRKLLILSGSGFILFKILFGCASGLWQFYVCAVGIGIFAPGFGYLTVNSVINRKFRENNGLAVGIASSGAGIVGAIVLPIVTWTISAFGWRMGYYLEAALALVFIVIAIFCIKENGTTETTEERSVKKRKLCGTDVTSYLLLLIGLFLICLVGMGIQPYLMAYMQQMDYTTAFAAGIVSAVLAVNTAAKIISGYVFDRVGSRRTIWITTGTMACSLLILLLFGKGSWIAYAFVIVFAFAYVALSIPAPFLTKEMFGAEYFTELYSIVMIVTSVGGAVGNVLTGLLYEASNSYLFVWECYIGLTAIAAAAMLGAFSVKNKRMGKNESSDCR